MEKSSEKHKFLEDSGMTFKDVYDFAYKQGYIPIMQALSKGMGKNAFIEMLKKAGASFGTQWGKNLAQNSPKNDLAAFIAFCKKRRLCFPACLDI